MNQADTAWMLISTALVLLMTPALAFFYGGLVRSKNALNTMMMSFISLGFVGVAWALIGYSLALSPGQRLPRRRVLLLPQRRGPEPKGASSPLTIPHALYMAFQATFCIITAALISGAIVERMRFKAYVVFISPLVDRGLCAARALGVGRRLPRRHGRLGLRRRHGRARQRRLGRAGRGDCARQAPGLSAVVAAAAQRAARAPRLRPALVRLVRVQRRQRAGRQPDCRPGLRHHDARARRHAGGLDAARLVPARASPPPSARPRPSWSGSWPSPPRRASSAR